MADKILITGGLGFMGLRLAQYFADNHIQVDLLDNLSRGVMDREAKNILKNPHIKITQSDLLDPQIQFSSDYRFIYHFAALLGVENVIKNPYETLNLNVQLTTAAINIARKQKRLERFIFASTSEVYAGTLLTYGLPFPTPETTPLTVSPLDSPRTSYMLSKIYGEALCHHSNIPFTIVRPHNIYGPRMGLSHVIPQLLQKAHYLSDGESLNVHSIEHKRTFCYVDDAVRSLFRMAYNPRSSGTTINIGNESPEVNMKELAEIIIKTVGKNLLITGHPPTPGSPERRAPETKNLRELTDYVAETSLIEGVRKTYEWYRENIFNRGEVSAI